KSIDAEYQFRAHSPNDNHSYGTGQMLLWQDCVARDRVFRKVFLNPSPSVVGGFADLDTATGAIDAPANVSDSTAPVSTLSVNGGSVSSGGTTYLSGSSTISSRSALPPTTARGRASMPARPPTRWMACQCRFPRSSICSTTRPVFTGTTPRKQIPLGISAPRTSPG